MIPVISTSSCDAEDVACPDPEDVKSEEEILQKEQRQIER